MNIVISGDGKVGNALTGFLTKEGHDITVIDRNPQLVDEVVNRYDVLGMVGNGASISVQKQAEVQKCDYFISVTTTDEVNIMSCISARILGAKHTIARVRNPEYYSQTDFLMQKLGIDMIVNPELEAAFEIERVIRFPAALKVERFSKGALELVELKIGEGHSFAGMKLTDFRGSTGMDIIICAVQRGDEVIIPRGNFVIQKGDKVHITASHTELVSLFRKLKLQNKKIKTVMLIGGGNVTYYLARRLLKLGISVKIIELDRERCEFLSGELPRATVICGDGTDSELLFDEGIDGVDACVALTNNDEENILVSMFAGTREVDKTITKVNRMSFIGMLPKINYDGSIISPVFATASHIVRYVRATENAKGSRLNTLYKIVDNKVEVMEFTVTENFRGKDVPLKDLKLKKGLLVAGLIRDRALIYPDGMSDIREGDRVIVVSTDEAMHDLNDILA